MIKLFGWERRVSERIQAKRNDELVWLWKLKVGNNISILPVCLLCHILGVRDTEWDRKVSVADCVIVCLGKTQSFK